jgi:hypothetical protein
MTLFVSLGGAVGWTTVRGTAPERNKEKFRLRPFWMPPSPTGRGQLRAVTLLGPTVAPNPKPRRVGGVLGMLLAHAGSVGPFLLPGAQG